MSKDIHLAQVLVSNKSLVDYFDPRNINHMKAFDELMKTGYWPDGFTDGYSWYYGWQTGILEKIAGEWTQQCMSSGGMKAKLHQAKVRLMNLADHRPEVETAVAVMGEVEHTLLA